MTLSKPSVVTVPHAGDGKNMLHGGVGLHII